MLEGGTWAVDQRPLNAHKSSVEDIQWSPTENEVNLIWLLLKIFLKTKNVGHFLRQLKF